jgi:putative hydrolase
MQEISKPSLTRFSALSDRFLNRDLHIHTTQTDGKHSISDVITQANRRGLGEIAFTEHVRRDIAWFPEFAADVREQAAVAPLTVYVGVEAKALDTSGGLDATEEILRQSDLVLGSVHRFPDGRGGYLSLRGMPADEAATMEFELAMGLLRAAPIQVLAHPGGMCLRAFGEFPERYFRRLMDPFVSIGSDVHKLSELATCRDRLRELGMQ